jgi:hypothetical protein
VVPILYLLPGLLIRSARPIQRPRPQEVPIPSGIPRFRGARELPSLAPRSSQPQAQSFRKFRDNVQELFALFGLLPVSSLDPVRPIDKYTTQKLGLFPSDDGISIESLFHFFSESFQTAIFIMNLIFDSLPQIVNVSGGNQKRTAIVLVYDVESILILFPEDFPLPTKLATEMGFPRSYYTLFEYRLIGGHWSPAPILTTFRKSPTYLVAYPPVRENLVL